ncbi:hypothetical protein BpHYR1_020848 [Brachionus plicatilis]|uniref:CDAN1-interacting nuclease 1 n=1 Tax=Brachionus plicatilis TaxID=10195 RepID=A0A3M7R289_BRAPC|nr:hypothetical protein BpHYR1_020848 [Brachionus plicatilis]
MNRQTFDKTIDLINKNKNVSKQDLFDLVSRELKQSQSYELNMDTFTSIYGNLKRRQIFKSSDASAINWRRLKENSVSLSQNYVQRCENNSETNTILDMANETGIAPILMARLILDGLIKQDKLELVDQESIKNKDKISISFLIRETHLLKDGRLAYEIMECCFLDEDYGPSIDLIKNLIGIEYECKLERILVRHGISFIKETELREKGFDKTPDFKLDIPICLNNGALISWIDSKATFGDEQSHSEYYENQFKFYLNRFGSGLVIYWFGYLKDIEKFNFNSNFINIRDSFPTDFTQLNLTEFI